MSAEREVLNAAAAALRNAGYATTADELIVVIAAMQQRAEEAEKDARRYRWLCEGDNASVRLNRLPPIGKNWPATLDEAIDAASTPPQAEGEGNGRR